jgi:hypothetical protein
MQGSEDDEGLKKGYLERGPETGSFKPSSSGNDDLISAERRPF